VVVVQSVRADDVRSALFDAVKLDTRLVTVPSFHERSREMTVVAGAR
jgi:hypothetical protein